MKEPRATVIMPVRLTANWQIPMTKCALDTLAVTTDERFQVMVVESLGEWSEAADLKRMVGTGCYVDLPYRANPSADINDGIDRAQTELVIYTGNDVFVRPGWLEALLQTFASKPRCGIATLASADLASTVVGQFLGQDLVMEGIYGPFMAFRRHWRFDARRFPCQFADADLVMRIYEAGLLSYRNCSVVIEHLNRQTIKGPEHDKAFAEARQRFIDRWKDSTTIVYRVLTEGWIV